MPPIPKPLSAGEEELVQHLRIYHIPFEREVQFDPERKWRADFGIDPMILRVWRLRAALHTGRPTQPRQDLREGYR